LSARSLRAICGLLLLAACEPGGAGTVAPSEDPAARMPNGLTAHEMIEARELHFKDLGGSFKSVRDQMKRDRPNLELVRLAASEVKNAAQDLPSWFPAGTGPGTGVEMRALASVWEDAEGFGTSAEHFREAAAKLQEAAAGEDLAAIRERARAVGESCGGCHDSYRAEEED
jgi:cytochrome c556